MFLGDDAATLESLDRLRSLGVRLCSMILGRAIRPLAILRERNSRRSRSTRRSCAAQLKGAVLLALARELGVETTAEGVETAVQADAMRALGCTQLQGHYFGFPGPVEGEVASRLPEVQTSLRA